MYYFNDLSPFEFEELCVDVANNILGGPVRMFARGKDGGVDLRDYSNEYKIVIQVKHYKDASSLVYSLKNEIERVKNFNPRNYYVMTSVQLSDDRVTEIYEFFKDYMKDKTHIIDGIRINEVLKNNTDIVRKNIKLWFHSANVLDIILNKDIYIDCEHMMAKLREQAKVYVKTKHFDIALKMLENSNILIITGSPASGKTILTNMIAYNYIAEGYNLLYSSVNNLEKLKIQCYLILKMMKKITQKK